MRLVPNLKVLLHRDSSHRGAHFAEDAQSKLTSRLAVALRSKYDLEKQEQVSDHKTSLRLGLKGAPRNSLVMMSTWLWETGTHATMHQCVNMQQWKSNSKHGGFKHRHQCPEYVPSHAARRKPGINTLKQVTNIPHLYDILFMLCMDGNGHVWLDLSRKHKNE